MSNPQRPGRRLAPVEGPSETFADAVRAAEALPPDGQDEGPDERPDFDPTSDAAYSWPNYGPLDHGTVGENELAEAVDASRAIVHTQVYVQIFCTLLIHNGVEQAGAIDFAARWAQLAAGAAAERYLPPFADEVDDTP